MLRWHVVSAVFWRNVKQYFSGPLGYMLIVMFVTACSIMAFSPQFFANNLATFDQLTEYFPLLLLFVIPAITMTVWAEEKRQGTDAILFTLPASDLDILIGKFLSVVAVFTVALAFSATQAIVLGVLGNPDWGVVFTTYVGYWLAGVALLSIGMFASSITENATIAYALGAALCAVPVLIGYYFFGYVHVERFGFDWNLRDFALGVVPLPNVVYFVAITIFMLYLNLIVISKRHWSRGRQTTLAGQFAVRAIALAVALISTTVLCSTAASSMWSRVDLTAEKLYTLDQATIATLDKVKENDQQVTIQAFVSSEVPRDYVNIKKQFVGLVREFGEYGGNNVEVRFVDVKPNSDEALNAKRSGIAPVDDRSIVGGKIEETQVYLGALISTSIGDATIPFVGNGNSIEYELSRSLAATVDKSSKLTIGILETDAFFGGPEFQGRRTPWSYQTTLDELKKQFSLKFLKANELARYLPKDKPEASDAGKEDGETDEDDAQGPTAPDILIVADPSSLDSPGMANLVAYVQAGFPAVIMVDPLPFFWAYQYPREVGVLSAPRMGRVSPRSMYAEFLNSSTMPKAEGGTAQSLMDAIGVAWEHDETAWSVDNPHTSFSGAWPPRLGGRWPELYGPYEMAYVWARDTPDQVTFNPDSPITAGLNELLFFYPGSISAAKNDELEFTPLVTLGTQSGTTPWSELTITPKQEQQFFDPRTGKMTTETTPARSQITNNDLIILNPQPATLVDDSTHVLAAHIQGKKDNKVNVVVIADSDFVSDLRVGQEEALNESLSDRVRIRLDNLSFFQNAIEVLAGNDSFVKLRNRRAKPRTLTRLEDIFKTFREKTAQRREEVEEEVAQKLEEEQEKLDKANAGLQEDNNLSFVEVLQKTGQQTLDAQKRFELTKARLDKQLEEDLEGLKTIEQNQITSIETRARYLSIFLAPLPALILGVIVLWFRKFAEERGIEADRRV